MNEALKPCPFCGGPAADGLTYGVYWVSCMECGCGTSGFRTSKEAADVWNRRPDAKEATP